MINRPRRSALYLPGSNPRALSKARSLPADTLIIDLEDSVAPTAKLEARAQVREALLAGGFGPREVVVRVNSLDTPWGADDLDALATLPLDAVLLPKVDSVAQVLAAAARLQTAGAPATLPLWVTAETPRGILDIDAIAGADPRLRAIVVGSSDLAKDLRVPLTAGRTGLLYSLSRCVLAARAHGLAVLDGVYLDLEDEAGYRSACAQGRELGFDGKTVIHPRQIDAANAAFGPSAEELARARRIIESWRSAQAAGKGVLLVDGKLVEALHVQEAERLLSLAAAIGGEGSVG